MLIIIYVYRITHNFYVAEYISLNIGILIVFVFFFKYLTNILFNLINIQKPNSFPCRYLLINIISYWSRLNILQRK